MGVGESTTNACLVAVICESVEWCEIMLDNIQGRMEYTYDLGRCCGRRMAAVLLGVGDHYSVITIVESLHNARMCSLNEIAASTLTQRFTSLKRTSNTTRCSMGTQSTFREVPPRLHGYKDAPPPEESES
jgi:hypothetical protein